MIWESKERNFAYFYNGRDERENQKKEEGRTWGGSLPNPSLEEKDHDSSSGEKKKAKGGLA